MTGLEVASDRGVIKFPGGTSWFKQEDGALVVIAGAGVIAEFAPGRWDWIRRLPDKPAVT